MPELPDIQVYVDKLKTKVQDTRLQEVKLVSPFVLRSFDPPLEHVHGQRVTDVGHIGKQIVLSFESDLYLVFHLMIAGRLRWRRLSAGLPKARTLAGFYFDNGLLVFTEASKRKRASLHLVRGKDSLAKFDRGGLNVLTADPATFHEALTRSNHTLKRALTDQRIISGIGNAYSDEILHRAQMSPTKRTASLSPSESATLLEAVVCVVDEWTERLRQKTGDAFPDKVTAFHPEMAVHGRYGEACPRCGSPVQRIVYAANESNYCAQCQTGGKLLADRALSRVLKGNWPRTLEELESQGST